MKVGAKANIWLIGFLSLLISINGAVSAVSDTVSCAVCGMEAKRHSRIGFEATHEGKAIHFCSLSCALRFHEKHKDVPILGHNFENGERVDTKDAYFLVNSRKILKDLEFGMPPSVVLFSSNESAKRTQARVGDGQVVRGFGQVAEIFK